MIEVHRPVRISVTGMDGSGKSSAYRAFVASVPPDLTVVRISRFSSVIRNGQEQIVDRSVSETLDNFHSFADSTRDKRVITVANTLCVLFAWRVQEKRLTAQFKPDLVLALRDPYIDPIAYAKFYSPYILGAMSIEERERTLRRLHGAPVSENVIFLDVDPSVAVARIDRRIAEEAETTKELERTKWVHLHENIPALVDIREEYGNVLTYFQSKHGVGVMQIDTVENSKAEVARKLRTVLLQPFESHLNVNPRGSKLALA